MTDTPPRLTASCEQILWAMLAEPWTGFSRDDVAALLGEIDRLRAEVCAQGDALIRTRAELAAARDRTLTEAAEMIMRDAEEQYQRSYSDNKIFRFNGAKRSADLLLAARTTTT